MSSSVDVSPLGGSSRRGPLFARVRPRAADLSRRDAPHSGLDVRVRELDVLATPSAPNLDGQRPRRSGSRPRNACGPSCDEVFEETTAIRDPEAAVRTPWREVSDAGVSAQIYHYMAPISELCTLRREKSSPLRTSSLQENPQFARITDHGHALPRTNSLPQSVV